MLYTVATGNIEGERNVFLGDMSYLSAARTRQRGLFVPDNDRYEGGERLLFDEHNDPVSRERKEEMTKEQMARCQ